MIHIHALPPERVTVRWSDCGDCKRHAPFVTAFYEWYGPTSTCMRCGRQWSDGEWMPLVFCRTARADNKADAKRTWQRFKARLTKSEIDGIVAGTLERMRS